MNRNISDSGEPASPPVQRPVMISGPCSAETRDQVMETARRLAATGRVHVLRAGVWKPRTRPGMFEGVGAPALPWLAEASRETGLPVAIEVATARQVEEALSAGIQVLWLGARTTANPFSVQEVADALQGVDVPVWIKNPINPDLELWTGALERIARAGVRRTGLIHRGFSSYGSTGYRNPPMWHLAIEMKRRNPGLAMLCDPSHMGGARELIPALMQRAIDLDYDGFMVETHIDPDRAWSDARQQITPERFAEILDTLVWRTERTDEAGADETLEQMRQQINQLDDELMQILGQRMRVAEQIGAYKKEHRMTILQTARLNEILDRAYEKGAQLGLSVEFIDRCIHAVHMESIHHQNRIMNGE